MRPHGRAAALSTPSRVAQLGRRDIPSRHPPSQSGFGRSPKCRLPRLAALLVRNDDRPVAGVAGVERRRTAHTACQEPRSVTPGQRRVCGSRPRHAPAALVWGVSPTVGRSDGNARGRRVGGVPQAADGADRRLVGWKVVLDWVARCSPAVAAPLDSVAGGQPCRLVERGRDGRTAVSTRADWNESRSNRPAIVWSRAGTALNGMTASWSTAETRR